METLDIMGEEGKEPELSATTAVYGNSTSVGVTNATNITFSPYYQHSVIVAASIILVYSFNFLLCMVGNILVCLIVLVNRRMRTVTNLFIFNLAISDLLVGIFCIPTTLMDNLITGWPFSNTVCKMRGFVQGVSVSVSVFTLVAIAVERFRCIVYPQQPKTTVRVAKAAIVLIWVLAMMIMCPAAVALTVKKVPFHYNNDFNNALPLYTCYEDFSKPRMRKDYIVILFVYIYMVPLTAIILMYGIIGVKLYTFVAANREPQLANAPDQVGGRRGRQHLTLRKKIRVIKMNAMVALLFMLSWFPFWTLMMMAVCDGLGKDKLDLVNSYLFPFAYWLAYANSSIHPIIYCYFKKGFKKGFQAVCKSRLFCTFLQSQLWRRITGWGTSTRSGKAPCRATDFGDPSGNCKHVVMGGGDRVQNDDNLCDGGEGNKSGRLRSVVVHSGRRDTDQGFEMAEIHKSISHREESHRVGTGGVYHTCGRGRLRSVVVHSGRCGTDQGFEMAEIHKSISHGEEPHREKADWEKADLLCGILQSPLDADLNVLHSDSEQGCTKFFKMTVSSAYIKTSTPSLMDGRSLMAAEATAAVPGGAGTAVLAGAAAEQGIVEMVVVGGALPGEDAAEPRSSGVSEKVSVSGVISEDDECQDDEGSEMTVCDEQSDRQVKVRNESPKSKILVCDDLYDDEDLSDEELIKISQKRKISDNVQTSAKALNAKRDRKAGAVPAESDSNFMSTQEESNNYSLAQIRKFQHNTTFSI
ncbi:orexin receptor type 2-like [Cheilinus undulatus]|uniref:orexin receptor type 2-like n=1 Tax=Cheilinus undulatus TaxID=241271 RepID=UPI001BD5BCFC|nr:orexin receptor type 2-like [Cheilinus undulatus]